MKMMEKSEAETQMQTQKASSCNKIMVFMNLTSRILTCVSLVIALVLLATATGTLVKGTVSVNIRFQSVIAYRYVMVAIVIGLEYSVVQLGFVLHQVVTGRRMFNSKAMLLFDLYADKVLSGLLATGAGAGIGVTIELNNTYYPTLSDYFNKGAAVSILVLFAYFCNEATQIVSSNFSIS